MAAKMIELGMLTKPASAPAPVAAQAAPTTAAESHDDFYLRTL